MKNLVSITGRPGHPLEVGHGGHYDLPGACVMEWVSLIAFGGVRKHEAGFFDVDWGFALKTDGPSCTNQVVTDVAITLNDLLSQTQRDRLARLLPRLVRAGRRGDVLQQMRTESRLVLWLVRRALELTGYEPSEREQSWLDQFTEYVRGSRERLELPDIDTYSPVHALYERDLHPLLHTLLEDRHYDEDPSRILEDLLDALDKAYAEEGLLAPEDEDPQAGYLSDEEIGELAHLLEFGVGE